MKVWVNGTFDVLHIGHMKLLEFASTFGTLRVGVDSDDRVQQKKGNDRPFNRLEDRLEFIRGIKYVDSVVFFDSDEKLIEKIKEWGPDIMVIGNDYTYDKIIGIEYIPKVIFFDKIKDKSTTKILSYGSDSNR